MILRIIDYEPGEVVERCFWCELDMNPGDLVRYWSANEDEEPTLAHRDCDNTQRKTEVKS